MLLKITFSIIAAASLVFLVWFLIMGNNTNLLTVVPEQNAPSTSFPDSDRNSETAEANRLPGTVASMDKQSVSDASVIENNQAKEIVSGFFQMTDDATLYDVSYDSESGRFTITLYTQDTKKARLSAESYILKELPYSKNQWCDFITNVLTNEYENPQLAGQNLGLSFCPDSLQL